MTHDPLCPLTTTPCLPDPAGIHRLVLTEPYPLCDTCLRECHCATITATRQQGVHPAETRPGQATPRPHVSVDPATLAGTPCLAGHRIPIHAIAELVWSDGVAAAQQEWNLTRAKILTACWYAGTYGTTLLWTAPDSDNPGNYQDMPTTPEWLTRWRTWAHDAHTHLWHGNHEHAPDPPTTRHP